MTTLEEGRLSRVDATNSKRVDCGNLDVQIYKQSGNDEICVGNRLALD